MVSKSCSSCLYTLRRYPRSMKKLSRNTSRTLMATSSFQAIGREPNADSTKSARNVTSLKAESDWNSTKSLSPLKAATQFQKVTSRATETYTVYGVTERMFKECSRQAGYAIPQASDLNVEMSKTEDDLGLKPTFSTWSQVTMLHMYILAVRFRCLSRAHATTWQQHLLDHFFYDAENKMIINHNMQMRGTRNQYLKDLFIQWRGLLAAYDEGLVKGDPVLAAAIWRNVFKADDEVDVKKVAIIVSYTRRALHGLDAMSNESLQFEAISFGDPSREAILVEQRSRMMDLTFKDGKVINELVATN